MTLDILDLKKNLKNLTVDARQLKLKVSAVTILSRIKKEKIILRYTAIIDHKKIGYSLTSVIEITSKNYKIVDINKEISKFENVCGVYDVTGTTDIIIIAKFKERNELSTFVKGLAVIANVENTITHIVLNTVKENFRLT